MLDLMRLASEAVRAEHAVSGGGIHVAKGCHGCAVFAAFRDYVLEHEQSFPDRQLLAASFLGRTTRFAIWVSEPLTHAKWSLLKRYLDLLEPPADPDPEKEQPPAGPSKAVESGAALAPAQREGKP